MPEDIRIDIACEVSTEAWHGYEKQYGTKYVEEHWDEFKQKVIAETRQAVDEAEREWLKEEAERRKDWEDEYYQEAAYGWYQQDIIDMYRRER